MATTRRYPTLKQSQEVLRRSAELADAPTQATAPVPIMSGGNASVSPKPKPTVGPQDLWLSFFFDGTGNNLDADQNSDEHSNVARLFLAHELEDPSKGIFRFYIPGIGTLFKEVGDPGGEMTGLGFGGRGEERLQWAMKKLEMHANSASGRARNIHVALFGFSRGATLARAFAHRIAARCKKSEGAYRFMPGGQSIDVYFMGLFDTVASVGMAMSANNGGALGALSARMAMGARYQLTSPSSPWYIAGGEEPGADPSPGRLDGHSAWAKELSIHPIVEQCVHMVAAHEIRNSFPLDSALDGFFYPEGCVEIVFPGAHSDVGGGYRRGEGARGLRPGSTLSLIPLRMMRDAALMAGVPLILELKMTNQTDFGMDSAGAADFGKLQARFNHYMKAVKSGSDAGLGKQMLAHMKLYYQWRFFKIARDVAAWKAGRLTKDQVRLRASEARWAAEKKLQKERMLALKKEEINQRFKAGTITGSMNAVVPTNGQGDSMAELLRLAEQKKDEYLVAKSLYDTMPGSDGSLLENMSLYDHQLMADACALKLLSKVRKLRPHYRALLEAFEAEFDHGKGLRDEQLIAFFDDHVHDSLAGFAGDATLPSDPRVIYRGGDSKLPYAMNPSSQARVSELA
jgi:hypothetical protein